MARTPASAWWYRARRALARPGGGRFDRGSALVLAPHPDDESIACGLLVAAKVARGLEVTVAVATDGSRGWFAETDAPAPGEVARIRGDEWAAAAAALGVPAERQRRLGLADQGLTDAEAELAGLVGDLFDEVRPDQVFVTAADDLHPDHRALARATRRALAAREAASTPSGPGTVERYAYRVYPAAGVWAPGALGEEVAPTPTVGAVAAALPRLLRHREVALVAPEALAAKRAAVAAHVSQRRLLDGELRAVWDGPVELFLPLGPLGGPEQPGG